MPTQVEENFISLNGEQAFMQLLQPILFDESTVFGADWEPMLGVKGKAPISHLDRPNSVLQSANGCGMDPTPIATASNRFVNPERVGFNVFFCKNSVMNTALSNWVKEGNNPSDITGTYFEPVILNFAREAAHKDLEKLAYFGNRGSNDKLLSLIDGLWPRIFDLNAKALTPYVNTASGTELQPEDTIVLLNEFYKAQADDLYGLEPSQKVFYVTRQFHEKYVEALEDGTLMSSAYISAITEGQAMKYRYRMIEIKVMPSWTETIAKETGERFANYVLLTAKRNFVFATDGTNTSPQDTVDVYYDRRDRVWTAYCEFAIDVNYKRHEFMVAGY